MRKRKPGLRRYSRALQPRGPCELEVVQPSSPDNERSAERSARVWSKEKASPFFFPLMFHLSWSKASAWKSPCSYQYGNTQNAAFWHLPFFSLCRFPLRLTCHVWLKVQMLKSGRRVSWRFHLPISESFLTSRWTPMSSFDISLS